MAEIMSVLSLPHENYPKGSQIGEKVRIEIGYQEKRQWKESKILTALSLIVQLHVGRQTHIF